MATKRYLWYASYRYNTWLFLSWSLRTFQLGGATSEIGDPTGRTTSRPEQSKDARQKNRAAMHQQLQRLWVHFERYAEKYGYIRESENMWRRGLVNNSEWWERISMMEVLKNIGRVVRIGTMLGRDT